MWVEKQNKAFAYRIEKHFTQQWTLLQKLWLLMVGSGAAAVVHFT